MARATGIERTAEAVAEEAIVRAVESQAVERALARVLQGPALEEAVEQALRSPAVERALTEAINSEMIDRVWESLLASDEAQKLVERIAEAPEVRAAIAAQGAGLIGDLGRQLRRVTRRLDTTVEGIVRRLLFRRRREGDTDRAGFVSRALAVVVDAAILNGLFFVVSAVVALIVSALSSGDANADGAVIVVGAGAWLIAGSAYLVFFWSLSAQTPGMRFLGVRIDSGTAPGLGARRSVRRLVGTVLAALPLGLGFLAILTDERRRGWQDRFAHTEVRYAKAGPRPAPWSGTPEPGVTGTSPAV